MIEEDVTPGEAQGRKLLSAVERLVDDSDRLIALVEGLRDTLPKTRNVQGDRRAVAAQLITLYSRKSAISGALTAAPTMLPGGGTALVVVGGALADMTIMLKHEVELALCLTHLFEHDIRTENGRWLGYVLAAVSTYEARSGRNYFADLAEAHIEAVSRYSPRQMAKLAATAFGKVALFGASRGLTRAIPLVGIVVGGFANHLLTSRVGWQSFDSLSRGNMAGVHREADVVEAKYR